MYYCGREDVQWGDDYVFSEVIIEINSDEYTCETYNPNTKYCSYLHMFNAVVGFNIWAEVDPSPFEDWSIFKIIPDTIKTMVHALYKVPPGYCLLNANPEPEIDKVEGVKWNPNYQDTKYPYFLVDYFGKSLVPPWSGDNDYEYPVSGSIEKGIDPFYLIITGKNFGNKKGNISLEGKGQINKKTQDFTIDIIEWSDNKIKVCPRFENEDLAFEPVKDAVLTVYRPDGKKAEKPVGIIPSIGKQPFGQCTWWTYRRRMEEEKTTPYPAAYSNNFILNQNYVPEKYDILIWTTEHHQAFVEEVINKEMGTVRISEYNVKYSEELYNGEEGYETGENKIYKFSPKSSEADSYYR
jgi:surface antigen